MRRVKLLSMMIASASLLFGCSGGSTSAANKDSSSNKENAMATSSSGANFSANIDGQPVSGGVIDDLQEFNTAFVVDVDKGKELLFYLTDAKRGEDPSKPAHSLRFAVPDRAGSSSFGPDEDGWGIMIDFNSDKGQFTRYNSDSFTINITSLSATRVSGTFSGKFSTDTHDAEKKEITVTDGKFDIPFSTGTMRPT